MMKKGNWIVRVPWARGCEIALCADGTGNRMTKGGNIDG